MDKVLFWIFDKHLDHVVVTIIMGVVLIVGVSLLNAVWNPDYCDQACRQAQYLSEVVQECEKLDLYTREECITLVGSLR